MAAISVPQSYIYFFHSLLQQHQQQSLIVYSADNLIYLNIALSHPPDVSLAQQQANESSDYGPNEIDEDAVRQLDSTIANGDTEQTTSLFNPVESIEVAQAPQFTSQDRLHTISHRNRQRIQRQNARRHGQAKVGVRRQVRCRPQRMRVSSSSQSIDNEADDSEHESGPEVNGSEDDIGIGEWIANTIKANPKFATAQIDDALAGQMYDKAMAVGNWLALEAWRTICQQGRRRPTHVHETPQLSTALVCHFPLANEISTQSTRNVAKQNFLNAYKAVDKAHFNMLLQAIAYRVALADLYDAYLCAEAAYDSPGLNRNTSKGNVKLKLFKLLHPGSASIANPALDKTTKKEYKTLQRRLDYGYRYYYMRQELGAGILGLIADSFIRRSFIEQGLHLQPFHIWIEMIKHFNPQALESSRMILDRLRMALSGEIISGPKQLLETSKCPNLKGITDVKILFDEPDPAALTSEDENVQNLQSSQLGSSMLQDENLLARGSLDNGLGFLDLGLETQQLCLGEMMLGLE